MAECAPQCVPQLSLVILTKVASMLPKDETGYSFKNRLQLSSVSRQLHQAVLSSIQQMKRRHMRIAISDNDAVSVNGVAIKQDDDGYDGLAQSSQRFQLATVANKVNVKKELRWNWQMDCIDALQAFVQPNSLHLITCLDGSFSKQPTILTYFSPVSLTRLDLLVRNVEEIGLDSPLDQMLKVVASKTNLKTLRVYVGYDADECSDELAEIHMESSPSVPINSPFNHLLTLKNLHVLYIDAATLLSAAQTADLLNRSQSKITNICCWTYNQLERQKLFDGMSDVVRGNVVSVCCVLSLPYTTNLQFLDRLPKCATIHFEWWSGISWQNFNELGGWLLDVCCADDVLPGRTLECSVGCDNDGLQLYLAEGGGTQMEYTRDHSVVRLSVGSGAAMVRKHCPFSENSCDDL